MTGSASSDSTSAAQASQQTELTGEELFDGLFLGVGPLTESHPDVVWAGTDRPISQENIDAMHKQLREDDPDFFKDLEAGVTSEDPYKVRSALVSAHDQMKESFHTVSPTDPGVKPNGPCGWSACGEVFAVTHAAVAAAVVTIVAVVDAVPMAVNTDEVFASGEEGSLTLDEWVGRIVASDLSD